MILTHGGAFLVISNPLGIFLKPSNSLGMFLRLFVPFNLLRVFCHSGVFVTFLLLPGPLGIFLDFLLHFPYVRNPLGIF